MKTTMQVQIKPTEEQAGILLSTMERFNQACDFISEIAFKKKCFNKYTLQKEVYHDVKDRFYLSAQTTILAILKTVDSYKIDKKVQRKFSKHGAIVYDQRVYSFKKNNCVSLWTLKGRQIIPMVYGLYQKKKWFQRKGQADLVYKHRKFYLLISIETEEQPLIEPEGYIGVDLGINKIAVCSDGTEFSGKQIDDCREKFERQRKALQAKGTKSAKRKLTRVRNKESNFRRNINHNIAKAIVNTAIASKCAIVLEDLKGIRKNMKAPKENRSRIHGWSFSQLREFITYKAAIAGIPVHFINPAYTSQRCSQCGYTSKQNRKTQETFVCKSCGFSCNADYNASQNIKMLGHVSRPPLNSRNGDSKDHFGNCAIA